VPNVTDVGRPFTRRQVLQLGLAGAGLALGTELAADPAGAVTGVSGSGPGPGAPRALTVSGLPAPLGLGTDDVFFAWQLDDGRRGAAQGAYRIVVTRGERVVWDSGRVSSSAQAFIPYAGPALAADSTYHWTVRTWDAGGRPGPESAAGTFDTGLADGDWKATWIRRATVEPSNDPQMMAQESNTGEWVVEDEFSYVRKEVALRSSPVVRARAYVSADQLYELYVNGTRVGKGLAYQFPDSQYYEAWDITSLLQAGKANAFGILYTWQGPAKGHPAGLPGVIARISVLHADGTEEAITTDGTWRVLAGAWLPGTQRDEEGDPVDYTENINGPAIPVGWDRPGYDDSAWTPATVIGRHPTAPWTRLVPVRTRMALEPLAAGSITRLSNGAVVADFGRVYAAIPQVAFHHGVPGRVITMHAGYLLDGDGQVSTTHGTQHTDMRYSYVQRGGTETFRAFDYLGFRYLQIDDPGETLARADIVALTKHVAVPDERAGTFSSSDPTVDEVFELGRHSALFCMQEQFVDTPTREKGSWLWDGRNESMTALVAFGDHNQTRKSLIEFGESQARYWPGGAINKIYPTALGAQQIAYFTAIYPEWVWNYWLHTGDRALLESLYPVIARVAEFMHASVVPGTGLITGIPTASDVPINPTDTLLNLLALNVFGRVAQAGAALGRPAGVVIRARAWRAALVAAVNRRLVRPDGLYTDGLDSGGHQVATSSQRTNAYAVLFGVVPTGRAGRVAAQVAGQGMATAPMCAADVLEALRVSGHDTAILRILNDPTRPGWANILARGGTFAWEVWDPQDTDVTPPPLAALYPGDSMSHGWGSNVVVAIQRALLGVVPTGPGFSTFRVRPPLAGLGHAAGRVPTPAGPITVSWARGRRGFELDVTVPPNTAAGVSVPAPSPDRVTESGRPVSTAPGVRSVVRAGGYVTATLGAGTYRFRAH
jgi:alpha-L-rhamnosidase